MKRLATGIVAACLLGLGGPARAEPPIWVVKDKDSTIVLFGSFHLLPPGQSWRPKALDQALSQADDLWFEIPMDTAVTSKAAGEMAARAALPQGETLSALLSKGGRRRLAATARKIGVPMDAVDRMQPWFAETLLSTAIYRLQGALADEGVERQIADRAPPGVRQVALEDAGQQIDMFASGTRAEQLASLERSLRLFEEDPGYFHRVMNMWLKGSVSALDREVVGDLKRTAPAQYKALIVDRNRAWAPRILERLQGSGRTVVVVGVGHLIGPDGLPALLRAEGVEVTGP